MQWSDVSAILPEIILAFGACCVLLVETFLKKDKTAVIAIAVGALLASAVVALGMAGQTRAVFGNMIVLNYYAVFFKVLFAVAGTITILMSPRYLEAGGRHMGEYYALLLLAIVGMNVMAASRDLIAFYVGLELMAVCSYLLAGFFRYRLRSNESALKYFLTGAFASAFTLYGISLLYGLTGATNYAAVAEMLTARAALGSATNDMGVAFATVLVVVGLGFKVSIAPFHMWTPDVYQGAPTPVAAFFSVGPKAAGFSGILIIFATIFTASRGTWSTLFIVLSILTMFVGSILAIAQKNVKRMLAYSSITHVGYLTAGLAALGKGEGYLPGQAILFYLAAYTVMNLGAFGILAYLKTQQPDTFDYSLGKMAGLGRRSPWAAVLMSLFMFSLTGIPGTAGFIGKFFLFNSVVRANLTWLAVIAVILSAVSAFYYLRVVIYMFFREPEEDFAIKEPINGIMAAALSLSAAGVLLIGIFPTTIWDWALKAFQNFFG